MYGFAQFRTMATAVDLGVFDGLHRHRMTLTAFAAAFGLR